MSVNLVLISIKRWLRVRPGEASPKLVCALLTSVFKLRTSDKILLDSPLTSGSSIICYSNFCRRILWEPLVFVSGEPPSKYDSRASTSLILLSTALLTLVVILLLIFCST